MGILLCCCPRAKYEPFDDSLLRRHFINKEILSKGDFLKKEQDLEDLKNEEEKKQNHMEARRTMSMNATKSKASVKEEKLAAIYASPKNRINSAMKVNKISEINTLEDLTNLIKDDQSVKRNTSLLKKYSFNQGNSFEEQLEGGENIESVNEEFINEDAMDEEGPTNEDLKSSVEFGAENIDFSEFPDKQEKLDVSELKSDKGWNYTDDTYDKMMVVRYTPGDYKPMGSSSLWKRVVLVKGDYLSKDFIPRVLKGIRAKYKAIPELSDWFEMSNGQQVRGFAFKHNDLTAAIRAMIHFTGTWSCQTQLTYITSNNIHQGYPDVLINEDPVWLSKARKFTDFNIIEDEEIEVENLPIRNMPRDPSPVKEISEVLPAEEPKEENAEGVEGGEEQNAEEAGHSNIDVAEEDGEEEEEAGNEDTGSDVEDSEKSGSGSTSSSSSSSS